MTHILGLVPLWVWALLAVSAVIGIQDTCQPPTACSLPAESPLSNGDLKGKERRTEAAWAECAHKVDDFIKCYGQASQ